MPHDRFSANTPGADRLSIIGESQRRQSYDVNYKADYLVKDVTFTSVSASPFHIAMKIDRRSDKNARGKRPKARIGMPVSTRRLGLGGALPL